MTTRRSLLAAAAGLAALAAARARAGAPASPAAGTGGGTPSAPPADGSSLDRPTGADAAIVVFEDLQCPDCAAAHPRLLAASRDLAVPLVIRDYPLPRHDWAFPAAILARWFTIGSAADGLDFRSFAFLNQALIVPGNLREAAEQFAKPRGLALPESVDPDGRLAGLVQADVDLGRLMGLRYVPLVFVVGQGPRATRWAEVTDLATLPDVVGRLRKVAAR